MVEQGTTNWCARFHQRCEKEDRDIPCDEEGICQVLGDKPFELDPFNMRVVDFYWKVVGFSGSDANGLPTISRIEYAEKHHEENLIPKDYEDFFDRFLFLHHEHRKLVAEEIEERIKSGPRS